MKRQIYRRGRWAWMILLLMAIAILGASVAKADNVGFDPSVLYVGELVFGPLTIEAAVPPPLAPWATYEIITEQVDATGAQFWGFCITPQAPGPSPLCPMGDGPQSAFEPTGKPFPFNIAVDVFGFDPSVVFPEQSQTPTLATPEPSTWLLLLPIGLLFGLKRLLWK